MKLLTVILLSNLHQVVTQTDSTEARVVIVGSGLSGYSAAAKLIENGWNNIIILEAENRTGGRVHSIPFRQGLIDMGAQWVHGEGGNFIFEMLNGSFQFGDTGFDDAEYYFNQSDGNPLDQTYIHILLELSKEILYNSFEEMENFPGSLGEFFANKYQSALNETTFENVTMTLSSMIHEYYRNSVSVYMGSNDWSSISARLLALSKRSTGNQWLTFKKEGFRVVFDFISKVRPNPEERLNVESKIQLNKEVTNINWSSNRAIIKCSDDSEYSAEFVVFTASLGVLKDRYGTLFTPGLPDRKISAIRNIAFGSLEQFFLEFSEPFWPQNPEWVQYSILWTEEDIAMLRGTDNEWLHQITYITKVDEYPNLLTAFMLGGRFNDFSQLSDTTLVNGVMWLLERVSSMSLPRPIDVIRSNWISQRNFLGSYSYLSMDTARNNVTPGDLAEPIFNVNQRPIVFFAGEATAIRYSYADGAVESGYRAGNEVLAAGCVKNFPVIMLIVIMLLVVLPNKFL